MHLSQQSTSEPAQEFPKRRPFIALLAALALLIGSGWLGNYAWNLHRQLRVTRELQAEAALDRQRQQARLAQLEADRQAQATAARQQLEATQATIRQLQETQRQAAATGEQQQEQLTSYAELMEKLTTKLGGKERVGVTPEQMREPLPGDREVFLNHVERVADTVAEAENLRLEIKAQQEALAKARGDLDRANEEVARHLIKIDSLKKVNEGNSIKIAKLQGCINSMCGKSAAPARAMAAAPQFAGPPRIPLGVHEPVREGGFVAAYSSPFSTFSIDVDTASYSMVRQQLNAGYLPDPDSVRVEEMINYFDYDYPQPTGKEPFSVNVEVSDCPWSPKHRLVRIGLKGRELIQKKRPDTNLVFLLDVSGSMSDENKLPLVKQSLHKLLGQLGQRDRIAIVVYAGAAGLVLPSTRGDQRQTILDAIDKLEAGGSTAGGAGLELAYRTATAGFLRDGVNRVILCTDGDFNVGVTSPGGLERLIKEKAKTGVYLSILGFGMGNYHDNTMEMLSNQGNGNYAYIDDLPEADKVLVRQLNGTLVTIAKDVKIQVNFNKHKVSGYRLVGYENRRLDKEDFHDDQKDAGEIGAGHRVTALYEVVPVGVEDAGIIEADDDKYTVKPSDEVVPSDELLTVRLRYKEPQADQSRLVEYPVVDAGATLAKASADFKFAAAVAEFGMLLHGSKYSGSASYDTALTLAREGLGRNPDEYRRGCLRLMTEAKAMPPRQ